MSKRLPIESVGWVFFCIVLVLALAPSAYLVWGATLDSTPLMMRVFVSFFVAGFFAGVISWLANCILGFLVGDRDGAGQEEDDD